MADFAPLTRKPAPAKPTPAKPRPPKPTPPKSIPPAARSASIISSEAERRGRQQQMLDILGPGVRATLEQAGIAPPTPVDDPTAGVRRPLDPLVPGQAKQVDELLGKWFTGSEIVGVFRNADQRQFVELQGKVDMTKVLDKLEPWEIVQLGTFGPIVSSGARHRINETRADFLVDTTKHWGPTRAELFALYVFGNMTNDDVRSVLRTLAGDHHLGETLGQMPTLTKLLADRQIDTREFKDRGFKAIDLATGLGGVLDKVAGTIPLVQEGAGIAAQQMAQDLPEPYREAVAKSDAAAITAALAPGNVLYGTADYALFGMLSGVKGVVYDAPKAVVAGVREIAKGNVASGVEQLTGGAVAILGAVLGVRAFRKSAALASMLELTPEGGALYEGLARNIGKSGIDKVATYARASAEAQILIREEGAAGIEALSAANGDVTAARAALAGVRTRPPVSGVPTLVERLERLKRIDDPAKVEESLKNDKAFAERKRANEQLVGNQERLKSDLATARISPERFKLMRNGDSSRGGERLPLAFESWQQYDQFKKEFAALIHEIRVNGKPISAEARNIGTSAGFYSGNPKKALGHHFDRHAPATMGDVDIELNSPELVEHMLGKNPALNEKVVVGGQKVIFKNSAAGAGFQDQFPQFAKFSERWSGILKREVDVKLKADLTTVSQIPKSSSVGPIELFKSEKPK